MSFETLGLTTELLRAISDTGYTQPTPIQTQAIPAILNGQDILASAQTGTGKTAGFTLPLLQKLHTSTQAQKGNKRLPRALILTPTRELAAQVSLSVKTYARHLPLSSMEIYGGVSINPQISKLRKGVDIIVATPGRLLDHVSQRTVDLSAIDILVLDEADHMLDMGFINDIKKVLARLPKQKQTLLFSATFSKEIKQLANGLLKSPVQIEVARTNSTAASIEQIVHPVDRVRKPALLSYLIGSENMHQVLVFTRTKHGANRLAEHLGKDGIRATAIHGNKSQGARTRALAEFKQGKVRVLVATDIAARGLDIQQLPHVINYELPNVSEDYIHRIGRTGRAGHDGEARSLVCVDELKLLSDIERLLKRKLPQDIIAGYEPDPNIKAEPIKNGRNNKPSKPNVGKHNKTHRAGRTSKAPIHAGGQRNRRSGNQTNPGGR
ncbi:MAG: DEAD/DEAH box helicase [Gammaproteobacteria bacterium]|nr:DEAD/DEAH box helicase [Gammaproteobacteria bacterium]